MAIEVRWTLGSLEDIEAIAESIAKDSPFYTRFKQNFFFQRVEMLGQYPESGKVVPEIGQNDIRELIEGSYRIIYQILSDTRIDVLSVHHGSRLIKNNPLLE
jgi:toxin ParE1/3/4